MAGVGGNAAPRQAVGLRPPCRRRRGDGEQGGKHLPCGAGAEKEFGHRSLPRAGASARHAGRLVLGYARSMTTRPLKPRCSEISASAAAKMHRHAPGPPRPVMETVQARPAALGAVWPSSAPARRHPSAPVQGRGSHDRDRPSRALGRCCPCFQPGPVPQSRRAPAGRAPTAGTAARPTSPRRRSDHTRTAAPSTQQARPGPALAVQTRRKSSSDLHH